MSTRSRLRPRTMKRQPSSWLIVDSDSPAIIAVRSLTKPKKECGPSRSAARRWAGRAFQVVFRPPTAPRTPSPGRRGRSRGPPAARRRSAAELVRSKASRSRTSVMVDPLGAGLEAHDRQQGPAGGVLVDPGVLEDPVHVDVEDPGGVVGALDVPADPEQRLGEPAEHGGRPHCCCPRNSAAGPGSWRVGGPGIGQRQAAAAGERLDAAPRRRPAPRCPWSRRPGWS